MLNQGVGSVPRTLHRMVTHGENDQRRRFEGLVRPCFQCETGTHVLLVGFIEHNLTPQDTSPTKACRR